MYLSLNHSLSFEAFELAEEHLSILMHLLLRELVTTFAERLLFLPVSRITVVMGSHYQGFFKGQGA